MPTGEIADGGACGPRDRVLGVAGVFDVPRALPRCKDTSGIVPLSQCFRLERVAPFAFTSIFDFAFLLRSFSREDNDSNVRYLYGVIPRGLIVFSFVAGLRCLHYS